jgi:hypothetical protein
VFLLSDVMAGPHPQFDDPAFKAALQRVWGGQTAPPQLRKRVEQAILKEKSSEQSVWRRWRGPLAGLAAAAVLAIGFGLSAVVVRQSSEKAVPAWFADAIVHQHDLCAALPAQGLAHGAVYDPGNRDDIRAIRSALSSRLGYPVMVYSPGKDWKLDGARICAVGNIPAAHLMFTRGDESLSIFSISAGALYNDRSVPDGTHYAQVDDDHGLAGFVYGGALHCVVGHNPHKSDTVELAAVKVVRDTMFASHPLSIAPDVGAVSK